MRSTPSVKLSLSLTIALAFVGSAWICAGSATASTPQQIKTDSIVVMNAYLQTFHLGGENRTGHDPYAWAFAGKDKIQTESTAMALFYGGVENLGLTPAQLQEIYDFFAYMMDSDDWLYSDYTTAAGREYKKSLHTAWSLIAFDILEAHGIEDPDDLKARTRDALEAAIDVNGYMAGDPISNESIRTKFVQSLPFLLKVAQDTGDDGAIAAARRSIDFYMAHCIDGSYDVWRTNASGAQVVRVNSHEAMEFTHGLVLFHQYETDAARKTAIRSNLIGILNRYTSSAWTFTNSYGEKYLSATGSAGTVNTLSTFQIQYALAFAAREGWMASGLAGPYLPIVDRIKMAGFGDPERDNNFYYHAHPDTGASLNSNINSYNPGYVIYAIDSQYTSISGTVLDGEGFPLAGVSVTADGGGGSEFTDAGGHYELLVFDGWSGTVTPSKDDYSFVPASDSYTDVTSDLVDMDYTGTCSPDLPTLSPWPQLALVASLIGAGMAEWNRRTA